MISPSWHLPVYEATVAYCQLFSPTVAGAASGLDSRGVAVAPTSRFTVSRVATTEPQVSGVKVTTAIWSVNLSPKRVVGVVWV